MSDRSNHFAAGTVFMAVCITAAIIIHVGARPSGVPPQERLNQAQEVIRGSSPTKASGTGASQFPVGKSLDSVGQQDDDVPYWPSEGDADYYSTAPCYGEWSAQPGNPLGMFTISFSDDRGKKPTYLWSYSKPSGQGGSTGDYIAVTVDRSFTFEHAGIEYNLSCERELGTLRSFGTKGEYHPGNGVEAEFELVRLR